MNTQEEYNKIIKVIDDFLDIATKEEKKEVFKALQEFLKSRLSYN